MSNSVPSTTAKPIADGFFTWPSDEPRLIASHCKSCGTYQFPNSRFCPNPACKTPDIEDGVLSRRGKLFSYTFIYYPPPPPFHYPEPFEPYAIGLVDFPEGVRVIGIVTGCKLDDLRIGMELTTVAEVQYRDDNGVEQLTWKFRAK